ncbi:MAG: TolC family protein [Elusimicrobiota bacterium]
MIIRSLLAALPALAGTASALPAAALSLEDCVRLAVEKSPDLAVAAKRLDESKAALRKTYAPFSPQGTFTANQTQLGYDELGILNKGNRWSPNTYNASVNATWNVFNGFRDWDAWKGASFDAKSVAQTLEAVRHQLVLQTIQSYFGLLVADRTIEAQKENLRSKKEHYELADARFKAGVRSYSDVLNAQIEMKQSEIQLIDDQTQRSTSLHALNILLDQPLETAVALVDSVDFSPVAENLDDSIALAFKLRPEVLAAEAQVGSAEAARNLAYHNFLPVVSVGGLYDYAVSGVPSENNLYAPTLNPYWQVNLGVSFPFWDGGTRVQEIKRSRAAVDENVENLRKVRRSVTAEVSTALLNVERNQKVYKIADDQVSEAREDLKIITERYKNGGAGFLEVVDAQALLLTSQLNAIQSLYNFHIAQYDLRRATGRDPLLNGSGETHEIR